MIIFELEFENETIAGAVCNWPYARSEGVQKVSVGTVNNMTTFQGASLYWLYPEGENIVAGSGSVRYDKNPITEIVIAPDGTQTERQVEYMPDLMLKQIKLGWWSGWPRPIS